MKGVLFDLDGVLYNAGQEIPGAGAAIRTLQEQGIPHRFLTNTSTRSRAALVRRLARFGVPAVAEHIITPPYAAARWLREREPRAIALFAMESAAEEFQDLPLLPPDAESGADYVVVGDLGERWDYQALNRAFRLLHENEEATLVALGMSRYWQGEKGLLLDVGPFIVALEHAAERSAVVLGKPAAPFFQSALDDLGLPAHEVLLVGDDVRGDVAAAQAVGISGLLVRTGKYRPGDLQRNIIPDAVLDSVADLPAWWDEHAQ
jgi:phospholysine phosphohistidine inorganic pyrophosphate phosphatase